jgi:hypothetical protein
MGDHGGDAVDCSGDSVDSGADAMTFDMQKMREIAENCNSKDESVDHDYWNAHAGMVLQSALDEIERLRDREKQLLLDVDRNYREKTEYANEVERLQRDAHQNNEYIQRCNEMMHTDQKRIAQLEAAYKLFVEANKKIIVFEKKQTDGILAALDMYEELEKKVATQRAALKKLGKAKRARGKALVEERKLRMQLDASRFNMGIPEEIAITRARKQLHHEGKL